MNAFTINQVNNRLTLHSYTGHERVVSLPDEYEGSPITDIGAKAFLSCKSIIELSLPFHTQAIASWAFAHMKNLSSLTVPCNPIILGKEVFLDCPSLTTIFLYQDRSENDGTPYFLADAVTKLQDISLFAPDKAGSQQYHQEWIAQYDEALYHFLQQPDDIGFQPVFYGWFNDEDADITQRPAYIKAQKEAKTSMVLTRLLYPKYLSDSHSAYFSNYLASQMPVWEEAYSSKQIDDITVWRLYTTCHMHDIRYLDVLLQAGCCNTNNIPYLIQDLKDRNPEATARLLAYQLSKQTAQNSFEDFAL